MARRSRGTGVGVGRLEATLGLNTTEFYAGITRAQAAMRSASTAMRSAGRMMTMAVSVPLLAIGGASIKMSMDFETAFQKMVGLAGVPQREIEGLRSAVMKLSGDTRRPPQELADALYFIVSSGFEASEALTVLTSAANAARVGLGKTDVVADLLTSVMNAYGHANLSAASAIDTLIEAVELGKAEPEAFAASLGYVIPLAAEMGVEFNQVAASIAAMSRKMGANDVSVAVTNLRQIFSDLLSPTQQARAALAEWGTTAAEIRKVVEEDGLLAALGFINDQMGENEEAFSEIFGNVRSLTGALSLAGVSSEGVLEIFEALENSSGKLDTALVAVADTAQDRVNGALADLKLVGIQLGDALMPLFFDLVNWVKSAANWFSSLSEEGKKMTAAILVIVAAAGPLLIILGSIVGILAALSFEVILVVGAVAALAASFIYAYENWEAIVERISDWGWWRNLLIDMAQFFVNYNPFVMGINLAILTINDFGKRVTSILNSMIYDWNKIAIRSGGSIPMIEWIREFEGIEPFDGTIDSLEKLRSKTNSYKHEFKTFSESVIDAATKAKNAILGMFPSGGGGRAAATGASGIGGDGKGTVKTGYTPAPPNETWFGDGPMFKAEKAVVDLSESLAHSLAPALARTAELFGELFSGDAGAKDFFNGILTLIFDFATMVGQQLVALGVAALAFDTLLLSPGAAIAAGFALIAGAAAFKSLLAKGPDPQGLASGGFVTQGGIFQLHKDELVSLPMGSAVTPAHMAKGGGGNVRVFVEGQISGYNLDLVDKKYAYRRKRIGG